MSEDRKYKIGYRVVTGEKTREELRAADLGGCDALIVHSIIFTDDGGLSYQLVTHDGRTDDDLGVDEVFKAWMFMAKRLADDPTLGEGRRALARLVFEEVRTAILRARGL